MAEAPKPYVVVKFMKLPYANMSDVQCVPRSWIRCNFNDSQVGVAFPPEMTSTNKSIMRTGKEPIQKWGVFPAIIEGQRNNYKEWELEISPAGQSPQSPVLQFENLRINEPKPKALRQKIDLNKIPYSPGTSAAQTQVPPSIRVDEQLLKELHQTWKHMNSLMEKLFNTENKPN